MLRTAPLVCVLAFSLAVAVPTSALGEESRIGSIGWTVSASATDPFDNWAPAGADSATLYVWLYCVEDHTGGVSTAKFQILGLDPFFLQGFSPSPGVVNSSVVPDVLDLALPDCPMGSFLVGELRVYTYGVSIWKVCLGPEAATEEFATFGCDSSTPWGMAMMGYSNGFGTPCSIDVDFFNRCPPVTPVESVSWGRIKGMYE